MNSVTDVKLTSSVIDNYENNIVKKSFATRLNLTVSIIDCPEKQFTVYLGQTPITKIYLGNININKCLI